MGNGPVSGGYTTGSRIAGYLLGQQIGRGGMAVVFRAHDERLDRTVALKILAPAFAGDDAFRQRFIRESRAAAAVDDPHIIPVFEAGEESGVLFIAMRYVRGGDVGALVRRAGPLPSEETAGIVSQVASALDAAHAQGLVHRDVKPTNMLLDAGGAAGRPDHVYLSDFGLSKGQLTAAKITTTGQFLGTLDYMSPEQVDGKQVGPRSDQYSLACAAFELLTGAPPFERDTGMAVMYAHLHEAPPPLTSRRPEYPGAIDAVVARAMAKEPAGRYASCREFAEALREALGLQPYRSPAAGPTAQASLRHVTTQGNVPAGAAIVATGAAPPSGVQPADDGTRIAEPVPGPPTELAGGVTGEPAGAAATSGRRAGGPWWRSRLAIAAALVALVAVLGGGAALLLGGGGSTPPAGPVIFRSDFSTASDGWRVLANPADGHLGKGFYAIRADSSGNGETAVPVSAPSVYPAAPANIRVDVTARATAGPVRDVQYGLVCRSSNGHAYVFEIQGSRVTIAKATSGGTFSALVSSAAGVVQAGAAIRLSAVCAGVTGQRSVRLDLWVNGARVLSATDRTNPLGGGTTGIFTSIYGVSVPVQAQFSDFEVRQL